MRAVEYLLAACCVFSPALALSQGDRASSLTTSAPVEPMPASANDWSLTLPMADPVAFKGVIDRDKAGIRGAAMAYPATSGAVFLAAILVHGALNEAAKAGQRTELQKAADKVLEPYAAILSAYRHQDLLAAMGEALPAPNSAAARWHVDSTPVFSLTPDQTVLILENEIVVRDADVAGQVRFQGPVKVVGQPLHDTEPLTHWTQDEGVEIKKVTGALLRESIALAVASAAGRLAAGTAPEQTYRYFEGALVKAERATMLAEQCSRVVLKTLRSTLLSVPTEPNPSSC